MTRYTLPFALVAALLACGDGDTQQEASQETEDSMTDEDPSPEDVAEWSEAWCSVEPGVPKAELVEAMGEDGLTDAGESLSWNGYGYQFNAFPDLEGNIRQMDINTISLTEEEAAAIPCEQSRVADEAATTSMPTLPSTTVAPVGPMSEEDEIFVMTLKGQTTGFVGVPDADLVAYAKETCEMLNSGVPAEDVESQAQQGFGEQVSASPQEIDLLLVVGATAYCPEHSAQFGHPGGE